MRSEGETLVFTSPTFKHTSEPMKRGMEKVDLVYIDVGVNVRKANKIRSELVMLLSVVAKEISEGLTVTGVKNLLEMDAHQAMQFMALTKVLDLCDLRTPYITHKGIGSSEAKELSEKGLLHIVGKREFAKVKVR